MNRRAVVTVAAIMGIGAIAVGGYSARNRDAIERARFEEQRADYERIAWENLRLGLEHGEKYVRIEAAGRLAILGDASGWPVLVRGLRDPNPAARQAAAIGLAPFGAKALPEIRYILETDETFVRERAFSALGYMQDEESRAVLLAEYTEPVHVNMRTVLQALWLSLPEFAIDEIIAAVESGDAERRDLLAYSWVQFRSECPRRHGQAGCEALEQSLLDKLVALGATDRPASERARELHTRLIQVAHPSRLEGEELQNALDDLRDKDELVRWEAAQALEHGAPDAALPVMSEALRRARGDRVHNSLMHVLMRRRPDLAAPHAARAVTNGSVSARTTTSQYIREHPHAELIPAYAAALESPHGYVRLAAVEALNEIEHPDRDRLLARAFTDGDARVIVLASAALLRR